VLWRDNQYAEEWSGGVPGEVEPIEASVLAADRKEYAELAELESTHVPTVVLSLDYSELKRYEADRLKRHKSPTLDVARDRCAVGVGVGLRVLEERSRELEKRARSGRRTRSPNAKRSTCRARPDARLRQARGRGRARVGLGETRLAAAR
jgi:hypothetical protein